MWIWLKRSNLAIWTVPNCKLQNLVQLSDFWKRSTGLQRLPKFYLICSYPLALSATSLGHQFEPARLHLYGQLSLEEQAKGIIIKRWTSEIKKCACLLFGNNSRLLSEASQWNVTTITKLKSNPVSFDSWDRKDNMLLTGGSIHEIVSYSSPNTEMEIVEIFEK